jgi:hypothetical protein
MPNSQADVTAGAPNLESYTDNGDGTVTDNVTGLMWEKMAKGPSTWADAGTYCSTLSLGGHTDWRLPALMELVSIVDYTKFNPSINTTYFSNISGGMWSSTLQAGSTSMAWLVFFLDGDSSAVGTGGNLGGSALCVR